MANQSNYTFLTKKFYQERLSRINDLNQANDVIFKDQIAQKVGWKSYETQRLGFELLTNFHQVDWSNIQHILDVGCGYGDFVEYLRGERNFQGKYIGIDIIQEFIEKARKSYGNDRRNIFILDDFLNYNWKNVSYDIVVSLGALSINCDQPHSYGKKSKQYAENLIERITDLATYAIALYFVNEDNISSEQREKNPDMAFYRPVEIEAIIRRFSKKRLINLDIQPYPNYTDVKTIVRAYLKPQIGVKLRKLS
jgi:SAM-dependent methyltransferase